MSPIVTAAELRERIETALRARHATESVRVRAWRSPYDPERHCAACVIAGRHVAPAVATYDTEVDALAALAVAVGLNPDGMDPRAELETLRAIVERHAAEKAQLVREAHEAMEATVAEAVRYCKAAKDRMQKEVDAACAERDTAADRADAAERERDALRAAAQEFLVASLEHDVSVEFAKKRHKTARAALAALVGGTK